MDKKFLTNIQVLDFRAWAEEARCPNSRCGVLLRRSERNNQLSGARYSKGMRYCGNCGAWAYPKSICQRCGYQHGPPEQTCSKCGSTDLKIGYYLRKTKGKPAIGLPHNLSQGKADL